ncbi:MAG: hypothetical protein JWP81_3585 [Ferruginibacter sp.]|nr:hypothetical protein [Ferruginibacter sp.]
MKTYLLFTTFLFWILTGCNNSSVKDTGSLATKDTVISSMQDLSNATETKKLLCQNWENKEDAEDAALSSDGEGLEIPYRGFSFFEDASIVENPRDKIRFGKWSINEADKVISIEYNKGAKARYKIDSLGPTQMILVNLVDKKKVEYRADGKTEKNPADNPFYGANNQWRVKPVSAESDSAIKLRTEQCLLFYAKFLEDNADRKSGIISFVGLPTCFKWYRGGVSVTAKDKVEARWINCYYNTDQAMKAHAMLEGIISKKYKWNKEEKNWVKQSAEVVKQMYDTLKAL